LLLAALACDREPPAIPNSVSAEWQDVLRGLGGATAPALPAPDDLRAWEALQRERAAAPQPDADAAVARYAPALRERTLGGLRALEVTPRGHRDDGRLVVHLHGGGYAFGSPRESLAPAVRFADATGLRVLSLAYPLAPAAQWRDVVPAVAAALVALEAEGQSLAQVAVFGESAGGGLAAVAVLALRDQGHALPGALELVSPWADLTETGDTYATLREAERVYRYDAHLRPLAGAYAAPADQKHPWVSPVYGDFSKGWPPTLIQGGTHELFLSNFVRLYQAIEAGGGTATLDLYEGMPHLFPHLLPDSAESQQALAKARRFLDEHLRGARAR
jgi:acetyl esterase/lipase